MTVTMAPALEWVLETILDELDQIVDEREAAKGIVRTQAARAAGREAMRQKVVVLLKNEQAANDLRKAGAKHVRAAVRRMYEFKTFN